MVSSNLKIQYLKYKGSAKPKNNIQTLAHRQNNSGKDWRSCKLQLNPTPTYTCHCQKVNNKGFVYL